MRHTRGCNKYWNTRSLFGHLGKLVHQQMRWPDDGSIELEIRDCKAILESRGALV